MTSAGAGNGPASVELPAGFGCHVGNIGIKDDTDDVMVLAADHTAAAAGVFTKSLFTGASVRLSQANVADGRARAVVVVSKNSNVATGDQGERDAANLARRVAELLVCEPDHVLVGSTGLIGTPYPEGKVDAYFDGLVARHDEATQAALRAGAAPIEAGSDDTCAPSKVWSRDAVAAATAIMTTDTHPKTASAAAGAATVVGIAKGSGMIEPDMATMISVITTDAEIAPDRLDAMLRRVCDVTFNALSVDTDTSTSDMVVVLANGAAGPVDEAELEAALGTVSLDLTRQLAFDGEGAETLIVVTVSEARDDAQAKRVAKAIVNSPLVKTAVHGRDPNWGRVAMAIGKCSDETDIDPDRVRIRFGDQEVYPTPATPEALAELEAYLASDEVLISADLGVRSDGTGGSFTVYGCDLTDQYVRINADYTT
ncbi:MAG: bifunctional glutamate N-acetyltransferase/amino-acid acetyltransferase ArgJ [Acidimicrobiales bacterium]|nr:bifunctional glutamate N-acetyltransferase/amino-acid acetyltransferase ArgJ [Acidimicrobiales bacterium]MYB80432.1 bifunctional glutamate N-acetyltransferase/amino-acid acetyltransferase ArgJ [Acidimicrobiales bacterium]MYI14099.1 bifunctional glutamate N-acetyltransferase/amino-acid acetyltransferase ArgJ [Acidimicrobiales bacterium]